MRRRKCLTVAASDLRQGDRIKLAGHHEQGWQVLNSPVRLAATPDVMVQVGIRECDKGVSIRMNVTEQVVVYRAVGAQSSGPRT